MSDILSQNEIDALINKFGTGEIELERQAHEASSGAKNYDFRTANRFHKEQIRTLNIIYENFARLLATYLSGTLRVMSAAEVVSVEELKYQEFVNALPSPVVLAILHQPPLGGHVLFEVSPDISYAIISRLLGGSPEHGGITRSFTEIELVLVERIIRQFLPLFVECWEKIVKCSITLDRIETSPQFAQIVSFAETVAVISLSVTIGETSGLVNICLPHLALEPINSQLSTRVIFQGTASERKVEPVREDITLKIRNTPLDVTAVFNSTSVSVRDVLNLAVGDVLQLDHGIGEDLTLMVGHLPKFRAALGVKENRYAVKIADVIRKEESE